MTACPVCRDTGMVQCAEQDGTGMYEQACPEKVHDGQPCPICSDRGWTEDTGCNCGAGPSGYYGMHERYCGLEPCPRGCPFIPPGPPLARPSDPFHGIPDPSSEYEGTPLELRPAETPAPKESEQ